MIAAQVVQRIGQYESRVGASLWETRGAAQIETAARDVHLRQTDRFLDSVLDTEIKRVELRVRRENDVDSIETKTRFVHDRGTERVRLVQREDLPARLARIAEAGNCIALECRFAALVALE